MRHYSLNAIQKLPHFSEFTHYSQDTFDISQIVLSLGLYEAIVIDTLGGTIKMVLGAAIPGCSSAPKHISEIKVSEDIRALNLFLKFAQSVMLPCSECKREQVFAAQIATNPQNSSKVIEYKLDSTGNHVDHMNTNSHYSKQISDKKQRAYNIFDTRLEYQLGSDNLNIHSYTSDFLDSDLAAQNRFIAQCCIEKIIQQITELRKDFICSFDQNHRIFSNFIIYKASDCCNEPTELKNFRERKALDESITMTEKEQKIFEQYDKLKYCLIFEKVGQEPSMVDLQLFDIKKYSKVLSKEDNGLTDLLSLFPV